MLMNIETSEYQNKIQYSSPQIEYKNTIDYKYESTKGVKC